ncbi:MAG: hypothetical protein WBQ68_11950 [Terriglobales bacterium]
MILNCKTLEQERARLLEQQSKARRDEVFGGFTQSERAAYDARSNSIHELEKTILEARQREAAAADQRREWNKQSEVDTPQGDARQPYRTRERESSKAFNDFEKKSAAKKTDLNKSTNK